MAEPMPAIWWSESAQVWIIAVRDGESETWITVLRSGESDAVALHDYRDKNVRVDLPADAEVLVTVDWLKEFRTAKSERHRELATELAVANANLKTRIRQLEAKVPEVECPSCGAVIRARMADG
jgi:hypothetical protein